MPDKNATRLNQSVVSSNNCSTGWHYRPNVGRLPISPGQLLSRPKITIADIFIPFLTLTLT